MKTAQQTDVHVRWLVRRDLDRCIAIEESSSQEPWREDQFIHALRKLNCIGMVAEDRRDHVHGHVIYELHKYRLQIVLFTVAFDKQREGIGTAMIDKLKSKLCVHRRHTIGFDVPERNVIAQLFLRANGFRCEEVDGDLYRFAFRIGGEW
jgi:ribosomal-protein-alanine N-acetyltransferase